jgi:phthiocerol/phenolphthiocerol synthesis type-I polyketide synthase E
MTDSPEAIAVIGVACRLPGAADAEQFWDNLVAGAESVRFGTLSEQAALGVPQDELSDPRFVPVSAVMAAPEYFDAGFFAMPTEEARHLNPQHRVFLELAHTALEDGGYDPTCRRQVIGVYAASGEDAYRSRRADGGPAPTGQVASLASSKLELCGPSLTLSGPGATSLATVHLACQALRHGQCDMALAGGVNIDLPPGRGYVYAEEDGRPRDGHCRAFDLRASGAVPGSGAAVILLKRLSDALADGDQIRAVVIGSAVNHDGAGKANSDALRREGRAAAIARALSVAEVDPLTIGYVEAHGTGMPLDDSIEIAALSAAYGGGPWDAAWCGIGTVKTNIGDLGPAAGIAGLVKAVLALENRLIPASLNYQTPNPQIDFAASPFYVNSALCAWTPAAHSRRAGVNSFAPDGTNAHVLLEEAPTPRRPRRGRRAVYLLQLSARTPTALAAVAGRLSAHLKATSARPEEQLELADVAYTLRTGRRELPQRMAVVATDPDDAAAALAGGGRAMTETVVAKAQVGFMFPGTGGQYAGMGAQLHGAEPAFRGALDQCCDLVLAEAGADLRAAMLGTGQTAEDELRRPGCAQAAVFAVGYALARQWLSWGIAPTAMIGDGIGEYVAATIAGVFTLPDAVRAVIACGRLAPGTSPEGAAELQQILTAVRRRAPELPFLSSLTGDWITSAEATDPAYWAAQAREATRVPGALSELLREEGWLLVQCGPGRVLCDLARLQRAGDVLAVPSLPVRGDRTQALEVLYAAAGHLWVSGAQLDRESFGPHGCPVRLPTYPWERERFWVEPPPVPFRRQSRSQSQEEEEAGAGPGPGAVTGTGYVAPRSALEEAIAGIWAEELALDRVSMTDNFFELGGDSISGVRVLERMRQEAGLRLSIRNLLESESVSDALAMARQADDPDPAP